MLVDVRQAERSRYPKNQIEIDLIMKVIVMYEGVSRGAGN